MHITVSKDVRWDYDDDDGGGGSGGAYTKERFNTDD